MAQPVSPATMLTDLLVIACKATPELFARTMILVPFRRVRTEVLANQMEMHTPVLVHNFTQDLTA